MAAGSPHLPQAVVRFPPAPFQVVHQRDLKVPGVVGPLDVGPPGQVQHVEHLAPHVQLQLAGSGIAGSDRPGSLVAREPGELQLREPAGAVQAVHDLQRAGVAGHRAQQPLPPGLGLGDVPGREQRLQGVRGVAQPAVAVVPVARASGLFGERGRDGGDDAAGGPVGEGLQHDERALDDIAPRPRLRRARRPALPEADRVAQRRPGVDRNRPGQVAGRPGEHEGNVLTGVDGELGDGAQPLALQRRRGAQPRRVRPGDRLDPAAEVADPGDDMAVVEPQAQFSAHRHGPAGPLDDAHDVRGPAARGHEVDHPDSAIRGVPLGLEDQRVPAVAPSGAGAAGGGGQQPPAVVGRAEQGREAGGESKRGTHIQSMEPRRSTSAAVCRSPSSA